MPAVRRTTILFVCSANLCRSVTAQAYAHRAALDSHQPVEWRFESAGTDVRPGQRLPAAVESAMEELRIPVTGRPRLIDEHAARSADLILTAERTHRATVARWFPFAVRSTFTLLQFANLVEAGRLAMTEGQPFDDPSDLHEIARIGRADIQPREDESIDIGDPVAARTAASMIDCANVIADAIGRIVQ
jgi:protein-tyrosine phosphatase